MVAARKEHGEHTKIGIGVRPAISRFAYRARSPRHGAQMSTARNAAQMLDADSRQAGNLVLGKGLLT